MFSLSDFVGAPHSFLKFGLEFQVTLSLNEFVNRCVETGSIFDEKDKKPDYDPDYRVKLVYALRPLRGAAEQFETFCCSRTGRTGVSNER